MNDRLAARDAVMYWMRERLPNDQFLVYAFETDSDPAPALRRRARLIADLQLRVRDVPFDADYPVWVRTAPPPEGVVRHNAGNWLECRDAIAGLLGSVLDPRVSAWRLHVFADVSGVPNCDGPAAVVVLQLSHALADGRGASAIARTLFAADSPPAVAVPFAAPSGVALMRDALFRTPVLVARTVHRSISAARAYRSERALVEAGALAAPNPGYALTRFNTADSTHDARILLCSTDALRCAGVTVTVGALTAIAEALRCHLASAPLGAEVTVAQEHTVGRRNNFTNVGVDLHVEEPDLAARARKIGNALAERRARANHEVVQAQGRAARVTPAPLVRYGVTIADLTTRPARVAGNTVVTSVNRGPADLTAGGGPVRFTAGFPALSPVMGVTHGVYAIGDVLSIGVHSSRAALPDPDSYAARLATAVEAVAAALS